MTNRRIEMHEYRQVIYRLRQGQSARTIAHETSFGRNKIKEIKRIAQAQGWLTEDAPLPEEETLANYFKYPPIYNATPKALPYAEEIEIWVTSGIQASTIHQHLVTTYGFKGAYNRLRYCLIKTSHLTSGYFRHQQEQYHYKSMGYNFKALHYFLRTPSF